MSLDPLGFSGPSPLHEPPGEADLGGRASVAVPDRRRIGWPRWDRYNRQAPRDPVLMNTVGGDIPYTRGHPLNPYDRNVLKGDYPIVGDDIFLDATLTSDTRFEARRLPTPSGISSINVFKGYSSFRPVDWRFKITGVYNFNRLELKERNVAAVDVREGDTRTDDFPAVQEAFFEYHLGDTSPAFDIAAVRAGRQLFVSDFRGFIYNDVADGVRLLGNADSNRVEYNLALFNQTEKDTNSQLAELNWRDQQVLIANAYFQDFIWKGYTTQFSFHWNHDQSDRRFDTNEFLVRPSLAGSVTLQEIDAYYLGWTGNGHIGRVNLSHALYYAFGKDRNNPIAGRNVDIGAYMGALELSVDMDWFRPKVSALYASGDEDPLDGKGGGFDGIHENPFFAGGPSSFFQSSAFRLFGVNLTSSRSFFNDLAGAKAEGQSNFVNPGTAVLNAGFDAEITPELRTQVNFNSIWFANTKTLELFLNQDGINGHFGEEANVALQYRPALNNNVIFTVGASLFLPAEGYDELFNDRSSLGRVFTGVTLTF